MSQNRYFTRFEDILGGEYPIKENDQFYITQCPLCTVKLGYKKLKLYIKKDHSFGYCHRCKTTFYDRSIVFTSPEILTRDPLYLSNDNYTLSVHTSLSKYSLADSMIDEKVYDYFVHKRRNKDLLDVWGTYNMRHDDSGIYILYPGFNYYIKALYTPLNGMKYFLPPTPEKPPFIIDRGSNSWIICEGIFDAISISFMNEVDNIMAVTGSTMSSPLMKYLRDQLPSSMTIFLDDTNLSRDLMIKISSYMPAVYINIVESDGEDPEEFYLRETYGIIK